MTTAQKVARIMGDDGTVFILPCGCTLDGVAAGRNATREYGKGQAIPGRSYPLKASDVRYVFPDGSAIVSTNGWDIEGSSPWSWESGE